MASLLHEINPFISIYKTAKKVLNDYDKEVAESENATEVIRVTMYPTIKMVIEKGADQRQNNLSTADEVAVFIPNQADIRSIQSIILDGHCIDSTIVPNLQKIDFCNPKYLYWNYIRVYIIGSSFDNKDYIIFWIKISTKIGELSWMLTWK